MEERIKHNEDIIQWYEDRLQEMKDNTDFFEDEKETHRFLITTNELYKYYFKAVRMLKDYVGVLKHI